MQDLSKFGYRELELAIEQLQSLLDAQKKSGKLNAFPPHQGGVVLFCDEYSGEVGFLKGDQFYQFFDGKLTKGC
jgi:hypothetical protein